MINGLEATEITPLFKGKFISVTLHSKRNPDGFVEKHEIIEEKPGVLIVPITKKGEIVLLKTSRYGFGNIYEVIAGAIKLKNKETPLKASKRELQEEAGLKAKKFTLLSEHVDSAHCIGKNYIYLAENLTTVESKPDKDEHIEVIKMTPQNAVGLTRTDKMPFLRSKAAIWSAYIYMNLKK